MGRRVPWKARIGIALIVSGAGLFGGGRLAPRSKRITLDISPNHNQNIQWAQRLPLRPRLTRIPGFGLICATVLALLAILMMMLTFGFKVTSTGEFVACSSPENFLRKATPGPSL